MRLVKIKEIVSSKTPYVLAGLQGRNFREHNDAIALADFQLRDGNRLTIFFHMDDIERQVDGTSTPCTFQSDCIRPD